MFPAVIPAHIAKCAADLEEKAKRRRCSLCRRFRFKTSKGFRRQDHHPGRQEGQKEESPIRVRPHRLSSDLLGLINSAQNPGVGNVTSFSREFDRVDIIRTRPCPRIYPQVDFTTLSREAVHQYLVHFDIAPVLYPSPISALGPPPPEALLDLQPGQPIKFPSPMVTGAIPADHNAQPQHHQLSNPNRPTLQQQDHSIFSVKNYRSVDDDEDSAGPSSSQRTATLADIADLDVVLARLAERHFRDESVHELDTLATFLALVKNSANGKHPLYLV